MSGAISDLNNLPVTAAVGYFVDQKKGEVNELKQLLKNINVERDNKRKREVIKKVIAYMTLGIDVSRLFTDMIMAIETKDIVIKKMVYLFLCNYAHQEPEMAIMCINSLRRDCDNEDPLIRGLALRSLCSLRLESILEYIEQPLQKSLNDLSAYVRKTGVMGILKLHYLSPQTVVNNGYIHQLYKMLNDVDSNVVTNAIYVINELQIQQGGIEINQTLVMSLLNRIGEFSEWGLNTILDIVSRYTPANEDESFAIMNLLDPVLRTANSGSVLATFKCFMKLTVNMPDLQPQIYTRAKPPMLTLITGSNSETQYSMLKHLESILRQPAAKGIFDDEYRQFYVRYNEPPHVKHLKVELLPKIANVNNAKDIASELSEYVTDVDAELAKRAIHAIGEIAMKIHVVAEDMVKTLMELTDMDSGYVRSEATIVVTNVIRVTPQLSDFVLPYLSKMLKKIEDPNAKASIVWILGEFGENILEAPYMLEPIIDNYEEEQYIQIKLQTLSSAMKLFFKRPPEMQAMLGRLLNFAINDTTHQDLHDRALLYYRLLSNDINTTKLLFQRHNTSNSRVANGVFAEDCDVELSNKIFKEFNTLAVIYGMQSIKFIDEKYQFKYENAPASDFDVPSSSSGGVFGQQQQPLQPQQDTAIDPSGSSTTHYSTPATTATAQPVGGTVNLLDWDDNGTHVAPSTTALHTPPPVQKLNLKADVTASMTPQRFQQLWGSCQELYNGKICQLTRPPNDPAEIENALRQDKIFAIASGPIPVNAQGQSGIKLFVYGIETGDMLLGSDGTTYLCQVIVLVDPSRGDISVSVTIKADQPNNMSAKRFTDTLVSALQAFGPRV